VDHGETSPALGVEAQTHRGGLPVITVRRLPTGLFQHTRACGPGCHFNGITSNTFDWIARIGHQGSAGGLITDTTFTLATHGQTLTSSTFTALGIRAQSVGPTPTGGGGSAKDISTTRTLTVAVPEPDSTLLLALAFGWLLALVWGWQRTAEAP
jgi:hypothetical protein